MKIWNKLSNNIQTEKRIKSFNKLLYKHNNNNNNNNNNLLVNIAKQENARQTKTECIPYLSYVTGEPRRDNYVFVSERLPKKQQHM